MSATDAAAEATSRAVHALAAAAADGIDVAASGPLLSDHGPTPFITKDLRRGGAGINARAVALGPGEEPREGFVAIDAGGVVGRCGFAFGVGIYTGQPQVGFHGGCALEEMVVPMAFLAAEGVPADVPAWWHGRAEGPGAAPVSMPPSKPASSSADRSARPLRGDSPRVASRAGGPPGAAGRGGGRARRAAACGAGGVARREQREGGRAG